MAFPTGWTTYWQATPINPNGNLGAFVAYIDLSMLSGLSGIARPDGLDICVSDDSNNRLPCDLMPWYNNGSGQLYFNITKTTGNQPVRVWAGNPSFTGELATGTYGQYATYHANVYGHYPSGDGNDRTSYQNNMSTAVGSVVRGGGITGYAGGRSTLYSGGQGFYGGTIFSSGQCSIISYINMTGVAPAGGISTIASLNCSSTSVRQMLSSNIGTLSTFVSLTSSDGAVATANTSAIPIPNEWCHTSSSRDQDAIVSGTQRGTATERAVALSPARYSIGLTRANSASSRFFSGYIGRTTFYTGNLGTGYRNYDYLMTNQSSFWGTWSKTDISGDGGGGGGPSGAYQEITGYSDISTYSYTESNSLRNIFGESYVYTYTDSQYQTIRGIEGNSYIYTYLYGDLDVTNSGTGPIDIYGYSDTITYSYVGSCVYGNVPGMVGYWPLQDTAAGTVVSGIGCPNGIATGANPPSSVTVNILSMTGLGPGGLIPRSLFFNGHPGFGNGGTGQYIVLPITGSNGSGYLRNVDAFSYSIWAKYIQDDANNFIIVATPSGGSTKRASLELGSHPAPYSSNQRFESQISTTDATDIEFDSPVSPLSSGIWYNLVVTANFNTKTVNHYLNGELVLTQTGNFGSAFVDRNLSGFRLATAGVPGDINDNKFNGYLADFRLYHRELSETEARKLYRFGVDECIVGITQSLNINSPVYTASNNRASLIKSVTSESITNTRAEARAYLDMILSSISNTTTLSDGTLDEADAVISIASIVNVVTDSYGLSSAIRLISSESNTNTSSLSTAQVQVILNAIANIYTLAEGVLESDDLIIIEGMVRVLTASNATCNLILPLVAESNTQINASALGQVIAELQALIEAKTASFGTILKDIGLVSTSNTNTSFNGSVSLELSAASVVRVLTAMDGTATIEVEVDGNIIYLTVYVTMNDAQNPLYINQARVIELSNSRNISF